MEGGEAALSLTLGVLPGVGPLARSKYTLFMLYGLAGQKVCW